jgi:hypothetical protein
MLTTALVFAVACAFIELYLVTQVSWLRSWFGPLLHKYKGIALVFSTALSFAVGEIFGAQGVIVLMSAMFSTVLTITLYSTGAIDWYIHGGHKEWFVKVQNVMNITWKTFVLAWKIITAPVRFIMWCQVKMNQAKAIYRIQRRRFAQK